MRTIDIHYVDVLFLPSRTRFNVFAMTKAARTFLVTTRHEMPLCAMPTGACGCCRSCQP